MRQISVFIISLFYGAVMATEQIVSNLNEADLETLNKQRTVVEKYLNEEDISSKYQTAAGKLGTLRALLEGKIFSSEQTYELQSMGIVLGDTFVENMGFHWVMVEDEYGRDPAIKYRETSVILFPLTMISKRVERGEEIDVFDLFNGVADLAQKQIDEEQ
jgi:hypothetical protein